MAEATSVLRALAGGCRRWRTAGAATRFEDVPVGDIAVGDEVSVLPHEICPVDGEVVQGHGTMDESYLTGEPFSISKGPGREVLSGAINGDASLAVRATRVAADSRYAQIMQVMQEAEQRRPALRRIGDQLGAWYTPLALAVAGARVVGERRSDPVSQRGRDRDAVSAADRDSGRDHRRDLHRRAPRGHRQGSGGARAADALPHDDSRQDRHADLRPAGAERRALRAAVHARGGPAARRGDRTIQPASARAARSCSAADARRLSAARRRVDPRGAGRRPARAGRRHGRAGHEPRRTSATGSTLPPAPPTGLECVVLIDGRLRGDVPVSRRAARRQPRLRRSPGAEARVHARAPRVRAIGRPKSGAWPTPWRSTEIHAETSPEEKVAIVRRRRRGPRRVFIGDGINDAPALLAATVGIAFGQHSDVTSEAARVVIIDSSLSKVDELLHLSYRLRRVALQSAVGGMVLSGVGMAFAAAGLLPPVAGAVAQELIDLVAVLNALRTARTPAVLTDFVTTTERAHARTETNPLPR